MTERLYDYKNKEDLIDLGKEVNRLNDLQINKLFLICLNEKLMQTSFIATAAIKGCFKILRFKGKSEQDSLNILSKALAKNSEQSDSFRKEMIDHIVSGKDSFDPKSAGGFSSVELEKFVSELKNVGWLPDQVLMIGSSDQVDEPFDESSSFRM